MRRRDFAVDANVLRIVTRLGWLKEVRLGGAYCLVFEAVGPTEKRALLAKESMLLYTPPRKPKTLMQPTQPKVHLGVTTTAGSDGAVEVTVVLSVAVAKAPPPLKQMRIDDAMAGAPGGSGAGGVAATSQGVAATPASPLAAATPVRCGDATGAVAGGAATVAAAAAVGDIEDLLPKAKAGGLAARPSLKRFAKNAHSWFRSRIDDSTPVNKLCAATLGRRSVAIQREALTPATLHHTGTSPTST